MIIEKIENIAEGILNKLNTKSIPIQLEEITGKLQIKISRAPSKDFSGLLIRKDGHALIGINNNEALVRQRFTIAHELGHFFLHPRKDTFVDYRDNKKDIMRTPAEKQANMFAAALLMPRSFLEKDYKTLVKKGLGEDELTILANKYQVSEEAMRFRLMNLNL
jgi:Zn-dependent peptidase ImmA (M78 family)